MRNLIKSTLFGLLFISSIALFAQRDTTQTGAIDTQKLIVIKPYSPTVSDAVKPKQTPQKESDAVLERKAISYDIFSVPVASTFKPEKGRVTDLQSIRAPDLYNTYVALGLGNYFNAFAELYSTIALSDHQNMTLGLEHHSSQGGIKNLRYDKQDKFYDTQAHIGFNAEEDYFFWKISIGLLHQLYNWYGAFDTAFPVDPSMTTRKPNHTYTGASLDGDLIFKDMVFDRLSLSYRHFTDDFRGAEDHLRVAPRLVFPVAGENISIDFFGDYLRGSFGHALTYTQGYSWLSAGMRPSYNYDYGPFSFNLGAEAVYLKNTKSKKDQFYFYPKIKASYDVAGDYFKLYAGANGELSQNTYYDFAQKNPYLAPDLWIGPTNTEYNIYFGGKGKLAEGLHYDLRGNYQSQKNRPFFMANPGTLSSSGSDNDIEKWDRFDTFTVGYDNVETFSIYGGLDYKFANDFSMAIKATYSDYDTQYMEKPWNLPELQGSFTTDYIISDHWSIGADIFYVGQRYDFLNYLTERVKLDAYFDANFRLSYQVNDYLGFFANGSNLFNDKYDYWHGYEVQGTQFLLGLEVQF